MSNTEDIEAARHIKRQLGIPEGAVIFEVRIVRLLINTGGPKTWWRNFVRGIHGAITNLVERQ